MISDIDFILSWKKVEVVAWPPWWWNLIDHVEMRASKGYEDLTDELRDLIEDIRVFCIAVTIDQSQKL